MSADRTHVMAGGRAESGSGRLHHATEVAAHELRSFMIWAPYIWIILSIFTLHEEIALRTHGGMSQAIPYAPHGFAVINGEHAIWW